MQTGGVGERLLWRDNAAPTQDFTLHSEWVCGPRTHSSPRRIPESSPAMRRNVRKIEPIWRFAPHARSCGHSSGLKRLYLRTKSSRFPLQVPSVRSHICSLITGLPFDPPIDAPVPRWYKAADRRRGEKTTAPSGRGTTAGSRLINKGFRPEALWSNPDRAVNRRDGPSSARSVTSGIAAEGVDRNQDSSLIRCAVCVSGAAAWGNGWRRSTKTACNGVFTAVKRWKRFGFRAPAPAKTLQETINVWQEMIHWPNALRR